LGAGEGYRVSMAKSCPEELGAEVAAPASVQVQLHEVFDRAHFPTVCVEEGCAETDVAPLPIYPGRQLPVRACSAQLETAAEELCVGSRRC